MKLKTKTEHKKLPKGELSKLRSEPGKSNAYKHKGIKKFAGPSHTYPINDEAHARNALARAHFAKNPEVIKEKVYKAYPGLKKRKEKKEGK